MRVDIQHPELGVHQMPPHDDDDDDDFMRNS